MIACRNFSSPSRPAARFVALTIATRNPPGGMAGCALAFLATPAVLRLMGTSVPRAADAGVSLPVLGFVLFVSLISGVLFGLVPAVSAAKADLLSTL